MGSIKTKSIRIQDLTWPEIGQLISSGYITSVFALGSIEQHGPALPESTDTVQAEYIANRVAGMLGKTLQAPTQHLGCSDHHLAFPGTISLRKSTLQAVIEDYVKSLAHHGFTRIIILPFHGGNFGPTTELLPELKQSFPEIEILAFTNLQKMIELMEQISGEFGFRPEEIGGHADVWETSNMMYLDGEKVRTEQLAQGYVGEFGKNEMKLLYEKGMTALSRNGILGDSRRADGKYGRHFLDRLAEFLVEEIRKMTGI